VGKSADRRCFLKLRSRQGLIRRGRNRLAKEGRAGPSSRYSPYFGLWNYFLLKGKHVSLRQKKEAGKNTSRSGRLPSVPCIGNSRLSKGKRSPLMEKRRGRMVACRGGEMQGAVKAEARRGGRPFTVIREADSAKKQK